MGLFKTRVDENWKINYIKEFNEMRSEYEKKILSKQNEIDDLKKQLEELKCFRSNLSWSKATVCRVLNGVYD